MTSYQQGGRRNGLVLYSGEIEDGAAGRLAVREEVHDSKIPGLGVCLGGSPADTFVFTIFFLCSYFWV